MYNRKVREGNIEHQRTAARIINEALQNASMTYPDILRELRNAPLWPGRGLPLQAAKGVGRISAEINMQTMGYLRHLAELLGSRVRRDNRYSQAEMSFVGRLRDYARAETNISDTLTRYSTLAPKVQALRAHVNMGGANQLSDDEVGMLDEFDKINLAALEIASPAQFFLHFYDNGDLKFIWGMEEEDTAEDIARKTDGYRLGTSYSNPSDNW